MILPKNKSSEDCTFVMHSSFSDLPLEKGVNCKHKTYNELARIIAILASSWVIFQRPFVGKYISKIRQFK